MKNFLSFSFLLTLILALAACADTLPVEPGVSLELAKRRAAVVSELRYELRFSVPAALEEACAGEVTVRFELSRKEELQLDPLVAASALGYLNELWRHCPDEGEALLYDMARSRNIPAVDEALWQIWRTQRPWPGLELSAEDYNTLACELALRRPSDLEEIHSVQRGRITRADRLARFDFVWPSLSPDKAVRDSVFASLLEPENRATEPWVQESLRLLNHPLRQHEALDYLVPALDELQEIQRAPVTFSSPKTGLSPLSRATTARKPPRLSAAGSKPIPTTRPSSGTRFSRPPTRCYATRTEPSPVLCE